jgi:GNAT superfamily N-acetyltransferase
MTMASKIMLRDGSECNMQIVTPPVDVAPAEEIHALINSELQERFVRNVLTGTLDSGGGTHYFLARVGAQLAGVCWYATSPYDLTIGCLAGVATAVTMRRKGIARFVVQRAMDDFLRAGGQAMYLAFSTESAARLYEQLGFRREGGHLMRYLPARDFDAEQFAPAARVVFARVQWSDMPRVLPLYLFPHPCRLLDHKSEIYSRSAVPAARCVGVFMKVWETVAACDGEWFLLETDDRRVVGAVTFYPEGVGHRYCANGRAITDASPLAEAAFDFVAHGNFWNDATRALIGELIASFRERRDARGLICRCHASDLEKMAMAEALGFRAAGAVPAGGIVSLRYGARG